MCHVKIDGDHNSPPESCDNFFSYTPKLSNLTKGLQIRALFGIYPNKKEKRV